MKRNSDVKSMTSSSNVMGQEILWSADWRSYGSHDDPVIDFELLKKHLFANKVIAFQSKLQRIGMVVQKVLHFYKIVFKKVRKLSPTPRQGTIIKQLLQGLFLAY